MWHIMRYRRAKILLHSNATVKVPLSHHFSVYDNLRLIGIWIM